MGVFFDSGSLKPHNSTQVHLFLVLFIVILGKWILEMLDRTKTEHKSKVCPAIIPLINTLLKVFIHKYKNAVKSISSSNLLASEALHLSFKLSHTIWWWEDEECQCPWSSFDSSTWWTGLISGQRANSAKNRDLVAHIRSSSDKNPRKMPSGGLDNLRRQRTSSWEKHPSYHSQICANSTQMGWGKIAPSAEWGRGQHEPFHHHEVENYGNEDVGAKCIRKCAWRADLNLHFEGKSSCQRGSPGRMQIYNTSIPFLGTDAERFIKKIE